MNNFQLLISQITDTHKHLQLQAANAVNQLLTIRNWLIGYYIVEFEQKGEDRARYGENLIGKIATELSQLKGIDERSLLRFRLFYKFYPQIQVVLNNRLAELGISGSLSPILSLPEKSGTVSPISYPIDKRVAGDIILKKLSYSHLELLLGIEDDLKRTFYEIECIKGIWSVRELKRQINSLYFERCGMSSKPEKLTELAQQKTTPQLPTDIIKNVYAFEFLNLNVKDAIEESDLEQALVTQLQEFILELGNGFCFEARQKRILIGNDYYFIDLVFYHRILRCHVLVELKLGAFDHGDVGQLNTYLNFFKSEISHPADNPPVGILLVADKDHALVKFATAGMAEQLFVQEYLLKLPKKELLEQHIERELKKLCQ